MATGCIPLAALRDERLETLSGPNFKCFWKLVALLDEFGDGYFSDDELRRYVRMGKTRWALFVERLLEWEFLRRPAGEQDRLHRAGMVDPCSDEQELRLTTPAARKKESRTIAALRADMQAGFAQLQARIESALRSGHNAPESGQKVDIAAQEMGQNGAAVAPELGHSAPQDATGDQLINQSIDSKDISLENSIELIDDPVAAHRVYLEKKLIEIGIKREDVTRIFSGRNLADIASGIECVVLGFWTKAKTGYPSPVSLRNYLLADLQLPYAYQNLVAKRGQGALDILVSSNGKSPPGQPESAQPPGPPIAQQPARASPPQGQQRGGPAAASVDLRGIAGIPRKSGAS